MPFYRFLKDLLMIYFIHTEISTCQGSSLLLGKAAAQHCNGSPPWRMETKSWKGLLFLEQSWRTFQIIFPGPPQGFFYSGSFLYVPLQSLLIKKKDLHNFYDDNTISQLPKDLWWKAIEMQSQGSVRDFLQISFLNLNEFKQIY